ncbi:maleylpyruvate isomerase family mycothiol-dependent enzyme [Streptomyces sp. RPT161]|uniref:maleylpyruvate isomerase family mycothiol-dependent enzyme n=1 Tax=Streptomyces sp. RPT161 TaxID=3015993 RepID=UPI0022B88B2B|nr:maleylpyruvate isomerase family mycothiol-dependent enzyme [Streptomyces sp. RPT161]
MTGTPLDFRHDAAAVREATDRLLVSVGKLDDSTAREPSLLPGWTRGHVLAHLARNADALVNLLNWARTDVRTPMYASADARAADIERGADRPLAEHLTDLRATATRFDAAAAALPADRYGYEVEMRNGVVERADRLALRRLAEVELHHVDLDVGYTVDQLPPGFVTAELGFLATVKFAGHPKVPALVLATEDGERWSTGRTDGPPLTVTGSPSALVGWLTGRTDGTGLDSGGVPLPEVPPL